MPRLLVLRHRARPLALRIALLALAACAKPAAPVAAWDPAGTLAGRWEWVSSQNVQSGAVSTPTTEGFTAVVEFVRTSASTGTFRFIRSGTDTVSGTFGIASEDVRGHDFIYIEPSIAYLTRSAWLGVGVNSLRLGGEMERGFASTYVRIH